MPVIEDVAYGLIPVFEPTPGDRRYLLVLHQKGHWAFPKGHKEAGESDRHTACREFEEETGLTDYILPDQPPFQEHYQFQPSPEVTVQKSVTYFVAQVPPTPEGNPPPPQVQAAEIADFRWCPFPEALALITFEASRQLLQACEHALNLAQKQD